MDRRRQPGAIRAVVTSPSGLDGANKIFRGVNVCARVPTLRC